MNIQLDGLTPTSDASPDQPFAALTRESVQMMMLHQSLFELYKQFPGAAQVPIAPIDEVSTLHIECASLAHALIDEECNGTGELLPSLRAYMNAPSRENLQEVFDGAIDLIYVCFQLCYMLELPFEAGFAEVHANNLKKIQYGEDGKLAKRADGKLMKPEGHPKPDLFGVLERHSNEMAYARKTMGADNWKPGEV